MSTSSADSTPSASLYVLFTNGTVKPISHNHLQAGFVAAIQAQLLGLTNGAPDTPTVRAINSFFIGGMLLDIMAAMMGYLTIRWLERLRDDEQRILDKVLTYKTNARKLSGKPEAVVPYDNDSIKIAPPGLMHKFMALSLMIPLPFLMIGTIAMLAGIYVHVWNSQPLVVSIVVTIFGSMTAPFIICDFCIGRNMERRRFIIRRISELQGDW